MKTALLAGNVLALLIDREAFSLGGGFLYGFVAFFCVVERYAKEEAIFLRFWIGNWLSLC